MPYVEFNGIESCTAFKRLISKAFLKQLDDDNLLDLVIKFVKILKQKSQVQEEYKINHEIKKELIFELKN